VWVIPEPIELGEFIELIPDDAGAGSDFVAMVPAEPVEVLLFGTVDVPVFELDIDESLIGAGVAEAAGFGAVRPAAEPVAVGSPNEPDGAGVGLAVCAQATPAVIKTAAEASKSERIFLSMSY
jgi:hypothetical protein